MKRSTKNEFDIFLLKVLVCPVTKTKLIFDSKKNELVSKKAKLAYPINNGIPILVKEKARKL